ncbi:unnamed protein product [Protopolystoma xenopodis]|uniref:Uncharacterized protein n=1 Tax=Protopolystoma xenopodis TaxID=117903 RepID=A0A3S5CJ69_9PLAT|nr:unnamed protein product [Protopolystoma xenopodis]
MKLKGNSNFIFLEILASTISNTTSPHQVASTCLIHETISANLNQECNKEEQAIQTPGLRVWRRLSADGRELKMPKVTFAIGNEDKRRSNTLSRLHDVSSEISKENKSSELDENGMSKSKSAVEPRFSKLRVSSCGRIHPYSHEFNPSGTVDKKVLQPSVASLPALQVLENPLEPQNGSHLASKQDSDLKDYSEKLKASTNLFECPEPNREENGLVNAQKMEDIKKVIIITVNNLIDYQIH